MIEEFNASRFEGRLNFVQRGGVAADRTIERFHAANGPNGDPRSGGKMLLLPSDQGASGA
jgi:hypothetical protein